jgi:hypothetical protein
LRDGNLKSLEVLGGGGREYLAWWAAMGVRKKEAVYRGKKAVRSTDDRSNFL